MHRLDLTAHMSIVGKIIHDDFLRNLRKNSFTFITKVIRNQIKSKILAVQETGKYIIF